MVKPAKLLTLTLAAFSIIAMTLGYAPISTVDAQQSEKVKAMSDNEFWSTIAQTKSGADERGRQLKALQATLSKLSPDQILGFEAAFSRQMSRSYSWELWSAAYVIHGGCSDDGFDYFRRWLISRGRETFERALADPDTLASVIPKTADEALDFEEFGYVAAEVWQKRTGKSLNEFYAAAENTVSPAEPSGQEFVEDEAYLTKRYPNLWKRFGHNPLI